MASKAAVRVGLKIRQAFVDTAREEAKQGGERFTPLFLLAAFVEAVEGLRQTLVAVGVAGGGKDWREALEEEREKEGRLSGKEEVEA